jgi:hypothetical protein
MAVLTPQVLASAGIPPDTPTSGWFIVPEGEAGQIVNALATMGQSLNPLHMLSLGGLRSIMDDTVQSIQQTFGLATGQTTAWTVIHATNQAQVYALEQSTGQTPYPTKAAAQSKAASKNQNVGGSGTGNPLQGIAAIGDFFQRLTQPQTWVRVGEVALGGILVYAGVRALSHGSAVVSASRPVTRPVKKATKAAVSVAVPEVRLASRTVAKKAAPQTTARISSHRAQVKQYGSKKPYTPRSNWSA